MEGEHGTTATLQATANRLKEQQAEPGKVQTKQKGQGFGL